MEAKKNSNLPKAVAFFLIVSVLICAIAFSASGWQGDNQNKPDSNGNGSGERSLNGNVDENNDGGSGENSNVEPPKPLFLHYITGLETTEEQTHQKPFAVVLDSDSPLYGLSSSFMTVEIPIENGKTRLVAFTNNANALGKLGSIAPTRGYISNIAGYFGGVLISLGNDDSFLYPAYDIDDGHIDFDKLSGYHYSEFGLYNYTNADLISAYIKNNNIGTVMLNEPLLPYDFTDDLSAGISASSVIVSLDKSSTTELTYLREEGVYVLKKNGTAIVDKLNERMIKYDNAFILYADSTTYETADSTELILDTQSGGSGYYIREGNAVSISWCTKEDGTIEFYNSDGTRLAIKSGTSYIAFAKSSQASLAKFS